MSKLTIDRLDELASILAHSNTVAKVAARELVGPRKYFSFRAVLRGEPPPEIDAKTRRLIHMLPKTVRQDIAATEQVRDEISLAFMPILESLSVKYQRWFKQDSLVGEAWIALAKAIYSYTNVEWTFEAFFRRTIDNELHRYCLQNLNGRLTSRSDEYLSLSRAVYNVMSQLQHQLCRPLKADEIVAALKLDFPKTLALEKKVAGLLTEVKSGSGAWGCNDVARDSDDEFADNDYSALAVQIVDESPRVQTALDNLTKIEALLNEVKVTSDEYEMLQGRSKDESCAAIGQRLGISSTDVKDRLKVVRKRLRAKAAKMAKVA